MTFCKDTGRRQYRRVYGTLTDGLHWVTRMTGARARPLLLGLLFWMRSERQVRPFDPKFRSLHTSVAHEGCAFSLRIRKAYLASETGTSGIAEHTFPILELKQALNVIFVWKKQNGINRTYTCVRYAPRGAYTSTDDYRFDKYLVARLLFII